MGDTLEELRDGDPSRIGSYTLQGRLGAGGMGQVYLGRSRGGRLAAVKVVHAHLAVDQEFRTRFAREVEAVRRVSGVFTAPVIDADADAPLPWLATGYVNGPSLAEAVASHGPLPTASVLTLAAGLAEGLSAVHAAGVIHRDLKPSNVMLAQDGPRLIDFGISQAADHSHMTRTGMILGTPGFMSPEQAEGLVVGAASDIFSLGAVLLFTATGTRMSYFVPHLEQLDAGLAPLVRHCLEMDPARRPTATEFLTELVAAHPAAADQTDWLPAGILPAAPPASAPWPTATATPEPRQAWTVLDQERRLGPSVPHNAAWGPTLTSLASSPSTESPASAPPTPAVPAPAPPASVPPAWQPAGAFGPFAPRPVIQQPYLPQPARPRRRGWLIGAAAATALLVAAGALYAIGPWRHPPVLTPAGLTADTETSSSVSLTWAKPPSGPLPDKYVILLDGAEAGTVPGTAARFRETGLTPATSYDFRIIAYRGGVRSSSSSAVIVTTATPPLSAALMNSRGSVSEKLTAANPADNIWHKVNDTWRDTWSFSPDCTTGPCGSMLSGAVDGTDFSVHLNRSGTVYTGSTAVNHSWYCGSQTHYTNATLYIRITARRASMRGTSWRVTSFSGTAMWALAYNPNGCYADRLTVQVNGG